MTKIKVNFGNGAVVLEKSKKYIGVKKTATRSLDEPSELDKSVKEVLHPHLGGFNIVSVEPEVRHRGLTNDITSDQLDGIRGLDEVAVGTHVYHIAGSDKPLVPTGAIYITFGDDVTEKKQADILAKYKLVVKMLRLCTQRDCLEYRSRSRYELIHLR